MNPVNAESLKALSQKAVRVEIPDLGWLFVRGLTGAEELELDQLNEAEKAEKKGFNSPLWILSKCLLDENHNPLFPGEDGIKSLSELPVKLLKTLNVIAQNQNYVDDYEALEKNLEAVKQGVSSSVSVHC